MFRSAFVEADVLLTCTLLGTLSLHALSTYGEEPTKWKFETRWTTETKKISKVNALNVHDSWYAIGGFDVDGKGLVEIFSAKSE